MHTSIHSARATHLPASNMLCCKAVVQRTAHLLPVLYVQLLELEFVFGFFRHKRVLKDSGSNYEKQK